LQVLGHFRFVPWTDYGFSTDDPFSSLSGLPNELAEEGPAVLLARWEDEIANLSRIALRRHYVKLARKKVDLATALGESLKTVNSLSSLAQRIGSTLLSVKKGNIIAAFKKLFPTTHKEVANDYLAWKYGLKPLMGDLQGASEHLAEFISRVQPFKSNGHAKDRFEKTSTIVLGTPTVIGSSGVYEIRKATIRVKYGSIYSIPDKVRRQAASLGFTNPANVAWELLPLSFVVDWFLPIGDFLSGLSSLHGLTLKESYKTVTVHETVFRLISLKGFNGVMPSEGPSYPTPTSDRGPNGFAYFVSCNSTTDRETFYCKREVISLPDLPIPQFKNPIRSGNIKSALALFTQLVSK
jgi:hypothetical protein